MKLFSQPERASTGGESTSNEFVRHLAQQDGESIVPSHQRPEAARGRLDSWKEVAAYLRREVRTVQRWEKREGLPVHRHIHNKVGSVYAFKGEIDEWQEGRSSILCAMVSSKNDPEPVLRVRLSRHQLEKQPTVLCHADRSLEKRENEDSHPVIIFVAPELLTLPREWKSLRPGYLLAVGASGMITCVPSFATNPEAARGNRR